MNKNFLFRNHPLTWLSLCGCLVGLLTILWVGNCSIPARAAPAATIVGGEITTNTIWYTSGTPYLVDSYVHVVAGVTLTIQAGVVVNGNYANGDNYLFQVDGTLIAQGTAVNQIMFGNSYGNNNWSGIKINGTDADHINQGSILEYVILDRGGNAGSGVGGNLILQYSQVDVHHCQFLNSPGDGILGDDYSGGVANVYDSFFVANAGYAINFQNGSVNPVLSNLTASGNGASLGYNGDLVNINAATLSAGLHIWEDMGLPYLILGTMVATDTQLTIEPGVQVLSFPGNDNLDVQGSLLADGTASQQIHFDPITPTLGWSGIAIMGTEELPGAGGVLNHVIITKGGFGGNCDLYVEYGNATVTNSQLDSSQDSGVCLDHGATLVMTDTQLTNNQEYAMDVIDAGAIFYLDNLSASGNVSDTIGIEGGTMTGLHTWPKSGINTYDRYYSEMTIAPTGTLTIEPGVTVLFAGDITVKGVLNAIGTPSEPITFTGESATPGWWIGLNFVGTPEQHAIGHLSYATIEYGGYGGGGMISLENADVTFTHCILRYCEGDAIRIYPAGKTAAQSMSPMAALDDHVTWSQLYGISGYAINNATSDAVQAAYDWWGDASGPTESGNPDGTGSALTGQVLYWPFLTDPDAKFIYLPLTGR
jgi:hypothetical protein